MSKYDACLLGNGVLAPLGAFLRFFHPRKKFFCVVHGLDITFAEKQGILPTIYRKVNLPSLQKLDRLFMVGNATIEEAIKIGIPRRQCVFIPNGVNPEELKESHTKKELTEIFGKNISDKKVIVRIGRFVPHKGTSWFIDNVMPKLPKNVVMIAAGGRVASHTAGDRDEFLDCEEAIINNHLENRVRLLPSVPWEQIKLLLNTADLVVSPNIKISGSMEGFGINVIEAGACGRTVLASNLEGLADAIKNGQNGILVEPENAEKWIKKIKAILNAGDDFLEKFGERAEQYVKENYSWSKICQRYLREMEKTSQIENKNL
jgi:glycosyltransferase involved in cell wall biosynthesis